MKRLLLSLGGGLLAAAAVFAAPDKFPPATIPILEGTTDLATLLPQTKPEAVFDQWQNGRYGVVILKSGLLGLVYSINGDKLFSSNTWYLQGAGKDAEGKNFWRHLDTPADRTATLTITGSPEGYRVYRADGQQQTYFTWSQRIICKPTGVRVEIDFIYDPKVHKPIPEGMDANLFINVQVLADVPADFVKPNENPADLTSPAGPLFLGFDPRFSWYKGYWANGKGFTFAPLLGKKIEAGQTYSTWYELKF